MTRSDSIKINCQAATAAQQGCDEGRLLLSRRAILGMSATLFSTSFMPRFANAAIDTETRFLVVILRGGVDGIGMLVPKFDPAYFSMRQGLAIDFASTLSLGSEFGLHPAMRNVHQMFLDGDAAFAPAAGIPLRSRSHFECQDNLENGLPFNKTDATGWLNRLLGAMPAGDPIRVAHGLEVGEAPLILRGPEPVLGWSPTWFDKSNPDTVAHLETAYKAIDPSLWNSLSRGLEADSLAVAAGADSGDVSLLLRGFIGAARLMRAVTGPRIAVLSVEGWDMHADEGGLTGQIHDRLAELDEALLDLKTELGSAWAKAVVACVSEFGRTVPANGSFGTDHGIATVATMVGGAVRGGFVGDWPGIAANQLVERDALRPTVDLRSVFKGILRDHVGIPQDILDTTVFPDSAGISPVAGLIASPQRSLRLASSFVHQPSLQDVAPIFKYRQRFGL